MPTQAPGPVAQSQHSDLIRGLGLWSAVAIVIGDTIGTGIFLVSSDMARSVGSVVLVFAAWLIGGLIVLFGAFCYAELGAAFPKAGGPYVYLNRGLGPLWGFLFGWMSSFLERPVAMATLAAGFLRFLGFIFPVVATPLFTSHIGRYAVTFTVAQPLAALVVIAVTAINYLSVRLGGSIQVLLTSLKIGAILVIVVAGMLFGKPHAIVAASLGTLAGSAPHGLSILSWGTIGAVLTALVPAMWAYNGFNDLGDLGEEIQHPGRNIPRAIILGLLTVGGLYLLANVVYFRILPFAALAQSQHVASDVVQSFAGSRGATWLTIAMAISALGALHVVVLTGARIPYAMARDGVFFQFANRIQRLANFPRLHCGRARAQWNLRRALFPVRLCGLDFLRVDGHRPASSAQKGASSFPALSRLGLSVDASYFLARRHRPHCELVDDPSSALFAGTARDPRRHTVLLPLAQFSTNRLNFSRSQMI
jgi:APA family basic amino acid/polyamine antiporter